MKRYIHQINLSEIRVEVVLDEQTELISSTTIRPIQPGYPVDYSVDEQALADYNSFIEDTKAEIEDLDLEIIDSNKSKRSYTSRYFTIVDLDQYVQHTLRYLIFLRISDHTDADFGEDQISINKAVRERRNQIKERLSKEQGHKVIWKVKEVIVNGSRFASYDEAIEYIRELAEQWSATLKSHPRFNS